MRLRLSNVTLLSSRGTLQEVMHILLWMLVKQLENLQYTCNVLRLVNVSDHVIESKCIKNKNDIHSDRNLFFFSVHVTEFQPSAVELSITNCMGNGKRTCFLHFHAAQRTGKSKGWLISMAICTVL